MTNHHQTIDGEPHAAPMCDHCARRSASVFYPDGKTMLCTICAPQHDEALMAFNNLRSRLLAEPESSGTEAGDPEQWIGSEAWQRAVEAEPVIELKPESILAEADRLVNGERANTYDGTSHIVAALWSAYLGRELTVLDYAALMILAKVARTQGKLHRDSWVDIAGYAEVGPRMFAERQAVAK